MLKSTLLKARKGFTMLELLMVLLVISVLIAIGLAAFGGVLTTAQGTDSKVSVRAAQIDTRVYSIQNPGPLSAAGIVFYLLSSPSKNDMFGGAIAGQIIDLSGDTTCNPGATLVLNYAAVLPSSQPTALLSCLAHVGIVKGDKKIGVFADGGSKFFVATILADGALYAQESDAGTLTVTG